MSIRFGAGREWDGLWDRSCGDVPQSIPIGARRKPLYRVCQLVQRGLRTAITPVEVWEDSQMGVLVEVRSRSRAFDGQIRSDVAKCDDNELL